MPSAVEYVCCCESYQTTDKMTEAGVPQHERFEAVCLGPANSVLSTVWRFSSQWVSPAIAIAHNCCKFYAGSINL